MHRSTLKVENQTYYFDFDKSDIQDIDRGSLEVQAKYLASHPSAKVLLEGHTDPRGSREYNIALGERRAKAVASALKLLGVEEAQIRIVSYGAEKLAAQGHSDEDYQLDRRVNLVDEAK
ncbi:MAG: Peptidoglycan-associated lipoprotein [Legionellaceae bacterium]